MPIYEFKASDGSLIQRILPLSLRPELGKAIRVKGKVYRRVLSTQMQIMPDAPTYTSISLRKNFPGCKTDRNGRTVVDGGRRQEREILKQGVL